MKRAILYVRVSTDEQADKGYSQRNQDEVLSRYCAVKGILVIDIVYEDYSAKTFNRPEWKRLLTRLKKTKGKQAPDYILFTKWDRFSRNTADAYQMIGLLRSYGIEPQAIEQPLDLSVPENKMMLAFYLAVPEVENDRRALNVFHGMRRARKEGRWVAMAPTGYVNRTTETGTKYIVPKEPEASLLKWAFTEVAKGKHPIDQVWKAARKKGLQMGRNNFHNQIRNPVYCGKIFVPAFKDEPSQWVHGQHEPIISEELFTRVQLVLQGRIRRSMKIVSPKQLPLRGFLKCPKCTRMLSGSASKGCRAYYHYYHCSSRCGVRFAAAKVNKVFVEALKALRIKPEFEDLFRRIVKDVWNKNTTSERQKRTAAERQLKQQGERVRKALDLLLSEDLRPAEYRMIKTDSDRKIHELRSLLSTLPDAAATSGKLIRSRQRSLLNLSLLYGKGSTEDQRKVIISLFPIPLIYDGAGFSSLPLGKAARILFSYRTTNNLLYFNPL
ncbi:DNA invertase Pin-like site-specific DNA recombinase [Anseongella ginsenosidimutans]|uniref:DNA invertase Pin-like site-specific DNA recombinase n=1 Tax=Anseongella ginsenosidimutans TaxID=496056 RepID=A0A4R3KRA9_9SPHI|nr:recombinase family protein [Anseongella ginsenosidimutans]TCS86118.1 DNA invertase Pin-like site-specific DNA recombinase [Anseongella ginsenosidimutans]